MLKQSALLQRAVAFTLVGVALLLTGGCRDDDAHKDIDQLSAKNLELEAKVADLQAKIGSMQKSVNYDDVIENKVNAKIVAMQKEANEKSATDSASISDFVTRSDAAMKELKEAMHTQVGDKDTAGVMEEHLQNRIAQQAENEKNEREKMKADILRYIDSQLKDMYPYAFKKQKVSEPRKVSDQVDLP